MTALAESFQNRLDVGLAFFYPETCQLCGDGTRHGQGRLCLRALLVAGAFHQTAVLRTLRPALSRRLHHAV